MLKVINSDRDIAAVTCRQIPRSDADSFACFIIWNHYRSLGLDSDKILDKGKNFEKLSYLEKRKKCQLDGVCFMIKKELFEKFGFSEKMKYAEDLELGLRLIKNGYKIAYLGSAAVIHSHNRPPLYFLKRAFVDTMTLREIFIENADEVAYFPRCSLRELLISLIVVNKVINRCLDKLSKLYGSRLSEIQNLRIFLMEVKNKLDKETVNSEPSIIDSSDPIQQFFINFLDLGIVDERSYHTQIIGEILLRLENTIAMYENFLREVRPIYEYDEFSETIRKIFATISGIILACVLSREGDSMLAKKLAESLEAGV